MKLNGEVVTPNPFRSYATGLSDLLNPVDAAPTQIYEEDIQVTETDVHAVIKLLKTGKAPEENDMRPEMLKAMNVYGVRRLTHVCQEAWTWNWASTNAMANQCDNSLEKMRH